jgi:hypothetical protein
MSGTVLISRRMGHSAHSDATNRCSRPKLPVRSIEPDNLCTFVSSPPYVSNLSVSLFLAVLVYALDADAPQQAAARALLEAGRAENRELDRQSLKECQV